MRMIAVFLCLRALALGASAEAASALSPNDVIGTWRLLSNVREDVETGKKEDNLGAHPSGVLILTPDHRFMIVEVAEGRKASDTTEGLAALQKSMLAYTGVFTLSPDPQGLKMVNHVEISSNEAWTGTDQVRFLSMEGDRLVIKTPPIKNAFTGRPAVSTLLWQRSK
ncbi:MAG TPA: lipocalin-like domain-containing protein [Stellaceae bacterium]|nr:lipocalin-like domain-containing protein [Stellaceae bacterium]